MGAIRGLSKRPGDIKGTFQTWWAQYRREATWTWWRQKMLWRGGRNAQLYKDGLNDPDDHSGVVTYLEPGILQGEVKRTFGSITMNEASGGDRIPAEKFKILKDDILKELHSICQQIWKTQNWPQDWKRSVFIPIPKKGHGKEMFRLLNSYAHFICQQDYARNPSS